MPNIDAILRISPVIPVLVIADARHAGPIAEALVDGGLRVIEVTCRTEAALDAIRDMSQVPGAIVGAGTVLQEAQLDQVLGAGAQFIVSPGLTDELARAAQESGAPYLPGVATPSEIMRGLDLGFDRFKFFPAEASGGVAGLKALGAPFGDVCFCPTGGITQANAAEWLSLPQVLCVGGTWLVSSGAPDRDRIRAAAASAAKLARSG